MLPLLGAFYTLLADDCGVRPMGSCTYRLYCLLQDEVAAMQPKLQESHVETTQIMKQLQQVCVCGCGWGGREGEEEGRGTGE